MSATNRPPRQPNTRQNVRHRAAWRLSSVNLDCLIDLGDLADYIGDEYLAAILRLAADRVAARLTR